MARLMIVDDSIFQRKNLGKMAALMGCEVVAEASNGREAVERYPAMKPDLVLMDLIMPEMEGIEAVARILEIDKGAKIVIVSSIGADETVSKALSLGAKQFIIKPVDFSHAANIIKAVLEGEI